MRGTHAAQGRSNRKTVIDSPVGDGRSGPNPPDMGPDRLSGTGPNKLGGPGILAMAGLGVDAGVVSAGGAGTVSLRVAVGGHRDAGPDHGQVDPWLIDAQSRRHLPEESGKNRRT